MEAILEFISVNLPLILCLLVGVALLVLEVFVPGFGLPGIAGLVLISIGIFMTWHRYGAVSGLAVTLICLAVAGLSISISIKSASTGRLSRSALVLNDVIEPEENDEIDALVSKEGTAITVLSPSGMAEFDGVRLNVVSEGTYLSKGTKVRVIQVAGNRIVVRELK